MNQAAMLLDWLQTQRQRSGLSVTRIPWEACDQWRVGPQGWRHVTGGFFSIVGCTWQDGPPHLQNLFLPMIEQPEIGILGFVVRRGARGWEWLLHAKTEPGNVGGTHIGPSVQATYSNYMCAHGGKPTPMINLFVGKLANVRTVTDVEQSEQGDRFLGKYNRNMVVVVEQHYPSPDSAVWRWFPVQALRDALHLDYTINTDARSVLFCSDWSLLADAEEATAFGRWRGKGGFGECLLDSSSCGEEGAVLAQEHLASLRIQSTFRRDHVSIDKLEGWVLDAWGLTGVPRQGAPVVETYSVSSNDREVSTWCQPLMRNIEQGRVVLVCAQRDGVLQFALHASLEPGLTERAQFAPSWVTGVGHASPPVVLAALNMPDAITHASVMQSDEGGRFMHSIARYEIVEMASPKDEQIDPSLTWVTLAALRTMSKKRGLLTNELRSVLSLLLKWA